MSKIIVLMTSFNRRQKTEQAIASIERAHGRGVDLHVVLVDASSPDATGAAVRERFPSLATVVDVPRSTFWAEGMRIAWEHAQHLSCDSYLWLNDDVHLDEDAIERVQNWARDLGDDSIVVGATREGGSTSYSGYRRGPWWNRLKLRMVEPSGRLERADTFNGNMVWIPAGVDQQIGGFPRKYRHGMADLAYGFEASRTGVDVYVGSEHIGECARNEILNTWQDKSLTARQRYKLLVSEKGLPPRSWAHLALRYGGVLGILQLIKPYADVLVTSKRF